MNPFTPWLQSPATEQVARTLLHSLWQGGLIALVLAITLRSLSTRRPNVRYIVSCAALALIVITCFITFFSQSDLRTKPAGTAPLAVLPVQLNQPLDVPTPSHTVSFADMPAPQRLLSPLIVSIWILGVFGFSLYHVGGWLWLQQLRNIPSRLDHVALQALAQKLKLRRTVGLIESARVTGPWVVGIFKPMILVPLGLLNDLSPQQVEAILAHELAHIRRHDYLVNLGQASIETLLFYHPAVWWISNQIRQERECCCDEIAASLCGDPAMYVESLMALEEQRGLMGGLALAATGGKLVSRVRRVLGAPERTRGTRIRSLSAAVMALGILAMPLLLSQCSKSASQPATAASKDATETLHIVLASQDMRLGDKPISWEELEKKLAAIPAAARPRTILSLGVANPEMPFSRYHDASGRLIRLVQQYDLAYFSTTGMESVTMPLTSGGTNGSARTPDSIEACMSNLRYVDMAINSYRNANGGRLPRDLGGTLGFFPSDLKEGNLDRHRTDAQKAQSYLCPEDAKAKHTPEKPTAQWVNENTSYNYLGTAEAKVDGIKGDWSTVALAYEKGSDEHAGLVPVLFLDGHVEAVNQDRLKAIVQASTYTLNAAK